MLRKNRMKQYIERDNLVVAVDMMSNLPTDAAYGPDDPHTFLDNLALQIKVFL